MIYPEMKGQMGEITGMFSDMSSFSSAFGMDKINFGEFIGFFGVECGNVLGLGGAFFAALLGISAFISRGGIGLGLGLAALFYFLNIISNLTESAKFLKYITPFGYTDGAEIITNASLDIKYICVGFALTVIGIAAAFLKYEKKDIK